MLKRVGVLSVIPAMFAPFAAAEIDQTRAAEIAGLLQVAEMERILDSEGVVYAQDIGPQSSAADMEQWMQIAEAIYDNNDMTAAVVAAFSTSFTDAEARDIEAFFDREEGQEIVRLELRAREAFLDEEVEESGRWAGRDLRAEESERRELVDRYIDQNALISSSLAGSMNSILAFMNGLADAGDPVGQISESERLSMILADRDAIEEDLTDWIYGYMAVAYAPLSDEDFSDYVAFSQTDGGKALTQALSTSIHKVFDQISYELGFHSAKLNAASTL